MYNKSYEYNPAIQQYKHIKSINVCFKLREFINKKQNYICFTEVNDCNFYLQNFQVGEERAKFVGETSV